MCVLQLTALASLQPDLQFMWDLPDNAATEGNLCSTFFGWLWRGILKSLVEKADLRKSRRPRRYLRETTLPDHRPLIAIGHHEPQKTKIITKKSNTKNRGRKIVSRA